MWLRREECEEIVYNRWAKTKDSDPIFDVINKTEGCRVSLMSWSRVTAYNPKKRIVQIQKRLNQLYMGGLATADAIEINSLKSELEHLYSDLDAYWRQRSRVQWIRECDRNTGFFHAKASVRRKTNWVHKIRDNMGIWKDAKADIEQVISSYFASIFQTNYPEESVIEKMLEHVGSRVSNAARQFLSLPFTADEFGSVCPFRGLRQGDPISPYLFICCTEALVAMVHHAVSSGELEGIRIAPTAPMVASLCFADDTLVFCQATDTNATTLRRILSDYVAASGQVINVEKSTLAFCPMTTANIKESIHAILGFQVVERHDKYLGMPTSIGKTRKDIFRFLRERVWARIDGWGEKLLSKAGNEVLIKAVLQTIPSYIMSSFSIPTGLIIQIESAIRKFWWGGQRSKSMTWLSWHKLCKSKEDGGMGFRDLRSFNLAMLAKQIWRILTNPDLLLARILRARYFPTGDVWTAELGPWPSTTWRSLVRPFFRTGSRMRIGDVTTTSIWGDHWLMDNGNGQIFTKRPIHASFPNTVSDLIKMGTRTWNMTLIKDTFWPIDQAHILAVPIGSCNVKDRIIWHISNTGKFTLKSCYHAIHASLTSTGHRLESGPSSSCDERKKMWRMVWNLKIPPKIKHFVWRSI